MIGWKLLSAIQIKCCKALRYPTQHLSLNSCWAQLWLCAACAEHGLGQIQWCISDHSSWTLGQLSFSSQRVMRHILLVTTSNKRMKEQVSRLCNLEQLRKPYCRTFQWRHNWVTSEEWIRQLTWLILKIQNSECHHEQNRPSCCLGVESSCKFQQKSCWQALHH